MHVVIQIRSEYPVGNINRLFLPSTMISFTSFPRPQDAYKRPDLEEMDDMEVDEDYIEEGTLKLAWPGESLTSSHAYMRYGCVFDLYVIQ